jgi:NTE family protein
VLVLGPGLAQGFADVGVLRALHENHVPVVAILGAETGALVGGLYANAQSINRFEFRLLHFKEDLFTQPTGLLSSFSGNRAEKYKSELSRAFEAKDLTDLKIPLWVAIRPAGSNAPMLVQKGNAVAAIAAATANPAVFPPVLWENSETRSAPHSLSALVQEARSLNRGVVVVVSVDGETPADSGDVFVSPNLAGIGPSDFSKMTEAAFRGKTATDEKIAQIKHLVGLE